MYFEAKFVLYKNVLKYTEKRFRNRLTKCTVGVSLEDDPRGPGVPFLTSPNIDWSTGWDEIGLFANINWFIGAVASFREENHDSKIHRIVSLTIKNV